jgi:N-acetylneuraminate synthase
MVTNIPVLEAIKETGIPVILSTGGSTEKQVSRAVAIIGEQIEYILACTATYPCPPEEQNLQFIGMLRRDVFRTKFKIGFSNHSPGITFCIVAAALGAEMIEYHMTLDRSMYGSDQAASIEVPGMMSLNKKCRQIDAAMGTGRWTVFDSEKKVVDKLRTWQA